MTYAEELELRQALLTEQRKSAAKEFDQYNTRQAIKERKARQQFIDARRDAIVDEWMGKFKKAAKTYR